MVPALVPLARHRTRQTHFRTALAGSACLHLLLASALVSETLPPGSMTSRLSALTVTLELTAPPEDFVAPVERKQTREPPRTGRTGRSAGTVHGRALRQGIPVEGSGPAVPPALPLVPDPTVYPVGELDFFPRPVGALDIDHLLGSVTAGPPAAIRLDLTIDEYGVVREVAVPDGSAPGVLEKELRAVLESTPFVPGRRGGRAVKSRVTLRLGFQPGRGTP